MQPIRQLMDVLGRLASPDAYLFTLSDMRAVLPSHTDTAFKTLLSRAVSEGYLARVCRGLYLFDKVDARPGLLLYHAVNKIRPQALNYLSLESVLSEAGVISQIPIQRITVMSSARSALVDCGRWGSIEFVHTRQTPQHLAQHLHYDPRCRIWRASVEQALRDMRATRRDLDLIDWGIAHELI